MPIYMDRHDVSGEITAEMVADLHQKDLKIQHKYNCKGLTYWFDDKRKTAFCLIEAPNKAALKRMHDDAHGQVPTRIIEVDDSVVESFLGRIEDPQKSQKTTLNIINDPAFRIIMVVGIKPVSLKDFVNKKINSVILKHQSLIVDSIHLYEGRLVKQNSDYFMVSFNSVTKAVSCALKIESDYAKDSANNYGSLLKLQIALDAGVPVDKEEGFFENTIKNARCFFDLVKGTVVLSSEVKDLYESENRNKPFHSKKIVTLNHSDIKFLKDLMDFTEREWSNTRLHANDFCLSSGYSKSSFYRKIITLTGKSPNNFLKDYRLCKALSLLNKKNMNISETAFETGFNSPAYFSKCFQEAFGLLPSQYLKTGNSSI